MNLNLRIGIVQGGYFAVQAPRVGVADAAVAGLVDGTCGQAELLCAVASLQREVDRFARLEPAGRA